MAIDKEITTIQPLVVHGDERGNLVVIEPFKQIPFAIKRVFYIYGNEKNVSRGMHSHYKTKQFLIALHGSCKVTLDNGDIKQVFKLGSPDVGLYQDALIWGTLHDFSEDCVLMVVASELYDKADYITDYEDFCGAVGNDTFS